MATQVPRKDRPQPIASYSHTLALLGIMAAAISLSSLPSAGPVAHPTQRNVIPGFLESLAFEAGGLYFAWVGVHWKGGNLFALMGHHWTSWRTVLVDVAAAAPFWMIWEATAYAVWELLGPARDSQQSIFPVRGAAEIIVWIALSSAAGFCEELIYRGYFQRQFAALTGSTAAGVVVQGIVFGLSHPRGWKAVVVISVLGMLYGVLAAWRKDLKPGMLAHGLSDVWEGWLKFAWMFPK
ncbi:MAG TPA: CPBP family intramembrane glutamic endopeptidase [Terracidiphilus sp.]|nr:CPBP family intramembrane glutamic endopeptidase [Terracidiphilus sp.]